MATLTTNVYGAIRHGHYDEAVRLLTLQRQVLMHFVDYFVSVLPDFAEFSTLAGRSFATCLLLLPYAGLPKCCPDL